MDDDLAKKRLWLLTALRLGTFAPFLLGIAILYTGLCVQAGGRSLARLFASSRCWRRWVT